MDQALLVRRGKEKSISAADYRRNYKKGVPAGFSLLCPLCRQPLIPAAMFGKGIQSPHFRHKPGNERAQACENYASNNGYLSPCQRAPLPLFIRRSRDDDETFVVEAGFRFPGAAVLAGLEREGARLRICNKCYNVNAQRFGAGMNKYPVEQLGLRLSASIELQGASRALETVWGYLEDAVAVYVFSRDSISQQGRRIRQGDAIPMESDLYILAYAGTKGGNKLERAFPNAKLAGLVGDKGMSKRLSVYEVRLSKLEPEWERASAFLEMVCGYQVVDSAAKPSLLWPPALESSGEVVPLFKNTRCVVTVNNAKEFENRLYVHGSDDEDGKPGYFRLHGTAAAGVSYGLFRPVGAMNYVTADTSVFSALLFLHQDGVKSIAFAEQSNLLQVNSIETGWMNVQLNKPCDVELCDRRGGWRIVKVRSSDEATLEFADSSLRFVRIHVPSQAGHGSKVEFEKLADEKRATQVTNAPPSRSLNILAMRCGSKDKSFVQARHAGAKGATYGVDSLRAQARRGLNGR